MHHWSRVAPEDANSKVFPALGGRRPARGRWLLERKHEGASGHRHGKGIRGVCAEHSQQLVQHPRVIGCRGLPGKPPPTRWPCF